MVKIICIVLVKNHLYLNLIKKFYKKQFEFDQYFEEVDDKNIKCMVNDNKTQFSIKNRCYSVKNLHFKMDI